MNWKRKLAAVAAFVVSLNLLIDVPKALHGLLTGPLP